MEKKQQRIVDAAFEVFSRYGVKRATMNDIAEAAGVARQTLYNVFQNKDDILRATIELLADRTIAGIEAGCTGKDCLAEKLDVVFDELTLRPFEQIMSQPHADEILTGAKEVAADKMEAAAKRHLSTIRDVLAPHEAGIHAAGLTIDEMADFLQTTLAAFKYKARSKKHLNQLLAALKASVLAIAEPRD